MCEKEDKKWFVVRIRRINDELMSYRNSFLEKLGMERGMLVGKARSYDS